jgi:polar amino acid transport system substrate-binding protein
MVADFPICLYSSLRFIADGLVTLDKPLTYEPIGVALSGSDLLLVNWVQNVLGSLEKTGEMDRLLQKWFKESAWMDQLP